jgi:hypothetical protein
MRGSPRFFTAADSPTVAVDVQLLARCGYQVERGHLVAAQAKSAAQPSQAATQGQPRHTGQRHDAAWHHEAVGLGDGVDVAPPCAALDVSAPAGHVHRHGAQVGQVDDQAVAQRRTGDVVAPAEHADR